MQKKKLIDFFPEWATGGGIFSNLKEKLPWKDFYTPEEQDIEYFGNHSGEKTASPLVRRLMSATGGKLNSPVISIDNGHLIFEDVPNATSYIVYVNAIPGFVEDGITTLGRIIWGRFGKQWERLWDTVNAEYDALSPYFINTDDDTVIKDDGTVSDSGEIERKGKIKSKVSGNSANDYKTYGFNSTSAKNTDYDTAESESESEDTFEGRIDENSSQRNIDTSRDISKTGTKKGNIGIFTNQKLIEDERRARAFDFFSKVYKDLDSVLTCPLYELDN